MPFNTIPYVDDETLLLHVLNVGHGDAIIVELPEVNGKRGNILIDCAKADKTIHYLNEIGAEHLNLVVATHPHSDHIRGLKNVLEEYHPNVDEFWDSGFRHNSNMWNNLMEYLVNLVDNNEIRFIRPTAGLSTTIAGVEITVLAPSVYMKTRYDTYGVNINNSSIVLKLEYKNNVIILSGDAQWDSWAKMTEDFPFYEKTDDDTRNVQVAHSFNPLNCNILKIAHHGSLNGNSFECLRRLDPEFSIISCDSQHGCPDRITIDTLNRINTRLTRTTQGTVIYTVNYSIRCYQNNEVPSATPDPNAFNAC